MAKIKKKFKVRDYFTRGLKSDSAVKFKDLFLNPFAKALEGDVSMDQVLNYFFNVFTRDIFWVRVNKKFKLPGEYYITGSRAIKGSGPRFVNSGEVLTVRIDANLDYIDIERVINNKEHIFRLTESEYKWLEKKVIKLI